MEAFGELEIAKMETPEKTDNKSNSADGNPNNIPLVVDFFESVGERFYFAINYCILPCFLCDCFLSPTL